MISSSGALEAVERILNRGGDPDAVLRAVVDVLHKRGYAYAAVDRPEAGGLTRGARAGDPASDALRVPVVFRESKVAEFALASGDEPLVRRIATLISPYCVGGG